MSEISKLYKNVGIEPEQQDCCKIADKYWANNTESGFEYLMQKECPYNQECTDECEYAYDKVVYPPFTSEKVLKVIVFFLNKGIRLDFSVKENTRISVENFKECIAQIGAKYWQDLTEEDKQQIRGILSK